MIFLIDLPRLPNSNAGHESTRFSVDLIKFLDASGVGRQMTDSLINYDFSRTSRLGFVSSMYGPTYAMPRSMLMRSTAPAATRMKLDSSLVGLVQPGCRREPAAFDVVADNRRRILWSRCYGGGSRPLDKSARRGRHCGSWPKLVYTMIRVRALMGKGQSASLGSLNRDLIEAIYNACQGKEWEVSDDARDTRYRLTFREVTMA